MVLTVVYIREIISYAYFSLEDGEEANEIYNMFGLKKMISYSVSTVVGNTPSPGPVRLKESV